MLDTTKPLTAHWRALALAAGVVLTAGSALAQSTVTELTVTGRAGSDANARRLSAPVSYADLDLTTETGRATLDQRVQATARDLCRRLGEANQRSMPLTPTCERDAVNSARDQQRTAYAQATPRATEQAAAAPVGASADASTAAPAAESAAAPSAETYGQAASATTRITTNGPVPDTAENRERFGGPNSHAGRRTKPAGN